MLSKSQKEKHIEIGQDLFNKSESLIFVDFSGKTVEDLKALRRTLKSVEATFKVIKKRLLRIVLERNGTAIDPKKFDSQVGTIFGAGDISTIAAPAVKSGLTILGGYAKDGQTVWDGATVKSIGQLPPREILLGQLVGMLTSPLRMFMFVLNEKGKKVAN